MEEKPTEGIRVRIHLEKYGEVPILHANYLFISHTDEGFFITFAQVHPPYLITPSKEELEELQKTGLPARVIARLMVSPAKMKEFLDVLNENYEKFLGRKKEG